MAERELIYHRNNVGHAHDTEGYDMI